jgi:hypothetical protein
VLEHHVHIAIGVDVGVVLIGALQEYFGIGQRIRCPFIEQVVPNPIVGVGELPGLSLAGLNIKL